MFDVQAAAFAQGLALGTGARCVCDLTAAVSVPAIEKIMSDAPAIALTEACAGVPP